MRRTTCLRTAFLSLPFACLAIACASASTPAPMPEPAAMPEPISKAEPAAKPAPAITPQPAVPSTTAADAVITCYFGPSLQTAADGVELPGADLLLRRTVEPSRSRIVEETVRFDAQSGVAPRRYTVLLNVESDAFRLAESGGAFTGIGRFEEGEPWAWTEWTSDYSLASGIRVESRQRIAAGDDGVPHLTAERSAFGPDGGVALTLTEDLAEIDAADCARRFAALPPPG